MKAKKSLNILMFLSNPFMVDPRVYKEAKSLMEAGYRVTVIVWDRHNEYAAESVVDGIRIVRIHNTGLMRILPNDLFRNPIWWRLAYKKALELYSQGFPFDVVHCHDLDTLKIGVKLKKKLGMTLIYDAHEIFANMAGRTMPKFVVNFSFRMEKKLVQDVDYIITVNDPVKEYFESITKKHISIVMNCKDLIGNEYQAPDNKVFTISFIGVLHKGRMFPELVDIIGNIKDVKFVIAGKKENLYEEVKKRCEKYNNIVFLGTIRYSEVIPKTLESDLVVCMINPNDMNNRIGLANKQFEAMVCGRPIICTKGTYSGEMTEKLGCGLVVEYSEKGVRDAIITLRDNSKLCRDLGQKALEAAIEKYNWGNQKSYLLEIYEGLQ